MSVTTFGAMEAQVQPDTTVETLATDITAPVVDTLIPTDTPIVETASEEVVDTTIATEPEIGSSSFSLDMEADPAAGPETTQPPAPSYNWKEELKKLDRTEILKELGVNEFALEINEHIARGGNAIDYLNAKAIDYNQVSDEALLKDELRKKYPSFAPSDIEKMYNKRYGANELASEEDNEFAELQKRADAYDVRQAKIKEQQSFKIPESRVPQADEAYEEWKQHKENQSQIVENINQFYVNHAATKTLNESKRVAISLGADVPPFNFNIDRPELITQSFIDGGKILQKVTSTATGEPDVPKQQLISLFAFNPQKFMQEIFNYGQQMGVRNKIVAEGQNAQRPQAKVIPVEHQQKATYGLGRFGDKVR